MVEQDAWGLALVASEPTLGRLTLPHRAARANEARHAARPKRRPPAGPARGGAPRRVRVRVVPAPASSSR